MKHLKEMLTEAMYANRANIRKFYAELEKNGLSVDDDATGLAYLQNANGWELCLTISPENFGFYLDYKDDIATLNNPETEKEKKVKIKGLEISNISTPDDVPGETYYEYSKENAKILADALNAVK